MKLTDEQVRHVESLEDDLSKLTPERILEDAQREDSPIHSLFEWDVEKLARAQWMHQAREIIGAVTVIVTTQTRTIEVPKYVRDPEAGSGQGYVSVTALRNRPEQARESLIYTLTVASGHLRRAYDLSTALGMEAEIDKLLTQVMGVQRKLEVAA